VLRRQDGSYVAAFSALGATREGIVEAAREDYAALVEENVGHLASFSGKRLSGEGGFFLFNQVRGRGILGTSY